MFGGKNSMQSLIPPLPPKKIPSVIHYSFICPMHILQFVIFEKMQLAMKLGHIAGSPKHQNLPPMNFISTQRKMPGFNFVYNFYDVFLNSNNTGQQHFDCMRYFNWFWKCYLRWFKIICNQYFYIRQPSRKRFSKKNSVFW